MNSKLKELYIKESGEEEPNDQIVWIQWSQRYQAFLERKLVKALNL